MTTAKGDHENLNGGGNVDESGGSSRPRLRTQAEALKAISDALKSIADIPPLEDRNLPKASLARKKRREKMRGVASCGGVAAETSSRVPPKKRRVGVDADERPKKARTQARYDPDVPMTKEETARWRREARRVRNRESAAASRAKTRDRIAELEEEVNCWKTKYEFLRRELSCATNRSETDADQEQEGKHLNKQIFEPAES